MWGHSWEAAFWKPTGALTRTGLPPPWHHTCSLQNREIITFCCLSHPVHGILLWQPGLTNAKSWIVHGLGPALTGLFWKVFIRRWQFGWEINHQWDPIMQNSRCSWQRKQKVQRPQGGKCGIQLVGVGGRGRCSGRQWARCVWLSVRHREYGWRLRKARLGWEYKRNLHLS